MIAFIFQLVSVTIYLYLVTSTIYLLVLAVAGNWSKGVEYTIHSDKKKIAVLIPAYKEDAIIVDTAEKAAKHNYGSSFFKVIVIADNLKEETIVKLRNIPVQVLQVQFEISTKARSLHAALEYLQNGAFEIAVILDADNIMAKNCLEKINGAFHQGCKAVQCHRIAKNEETPIAALQSISEEININLFRRGPNALGLSAAPLGSGMAFEFSALKNIFETDNILNNPAEDREIEMQLMKRKIRLQFLDEALVYDEKVSEAGVFEKQHTRWLEAQVNHIYRFFKPDMKNVTKTALYYHTFFRNLLLPRLLYLFVCCLIIILFVLQQLFRISLLYPFYGWWFSWVTAYFLVLLISIPAKFYTLKTLKAMVYFPVLFISMLKAIFRLKRNRKEFLLTPKTFHVK